VHIISLQQSEGKVTSTFPTMTIVAKEDTRNKSWSEGSIGAKLLGKLGWTEGQGLGRNKQGTSHALVAIRRADGVGLGATSNDQDTTGWKDTNDNFASVLRNLQSEHATATSSNNKSKSSSKKDKKPKLVLAKNRVLAGHAKKMRAAKDLSNKTNEEMACIFGGAVHQGTTKKPKMSKKRSREDDNNSEEKKPSGNNAKCVSTAVTSEALLLDDDACNDNDTLTMTTKQSVNDNVANKKVSKKRKKEKKRTKE
jgi:Pin2-interacting protein X1